MITFEISSCASFITLPPPGKEGYFLRFDSSVFCDYPNKEFKSVCLLKIDSPGLFHFYKDSHSSTLLIKPRIQLPSHVLSLNEIVLITLIPKWLPVISQWIPYFRALSKSGYNMVHFAPLLTRGISNSPYALYDQLAISDDLFDKRSISDENEKELILSAMLNKVWNDFGIISVTDIVWNHTACNSEWLQVHPEAGYNLKNSGHLRSAYELDEKLMVFSEGLANGGSFL